MPDNTVTLVGNVTRDPELRFTPSGQAKVTIGLAVSRRWQNRSTNDWEEQTSFFNVIAWRDLAENAAESVEKGSRIVVTGRLEQRSWETDNGERRSVIEVVADEIAASMRWATVKVTKVDRREGGGSSGGGGGDGGASRSGSSSGRPVQKQEPSYAGGYDHDEEPF
ncbi:MAG: single-stranded DNA-binding protein [Actinobacteria bacterium]|nr:single-stranded DNA-binding protein [Actinomycetota bacterium]